MIRLSEVRSIDMIFVQSLDSISNRTFATWDYLVENNKKFAWQMQIGSITDFSVSKFNPLFAAQTKDSNQI